MAELDEIIEQPSDSQKRITQLSDKVRVAAEEKETVEKAKAEVEAKLAESQRMNEFSEGFVDVVANNPAAKEFKDDIRAKVLSGYSVEDATYAVLGKAGKLGTPRVESFTQTTGGSATTNLPSQGTEKSISEMTQDERRAELSARGDLMDILTPRSQR